MIVITGATGKTGSAVAEALIAKGQKVRVMGRDAAKLKGFTAKGAEAAVGDLGDRAFLTKAFNGSEAVYALSRLTSGSLISGLIRNKSEKASSRR